MALKPGDINLAKQDDIARFGAAPYEYFEVLRREAPVFWNPPPEPQNPGYLPCPGFWVLSKYEDVALASKDHERFSAWENSVLWTDVRREPAQLASQRAGLMGDDEAKARLEGLGPAHALGRIGTVTEIAEAFEYLIGAEWATGSVLTVDGGLSLGVTNA